MGPPKLPSKLLYSMLLFLILFVIFISIDTTISLKNQLHLPRLRGQYVIIKANTKQGRICLRFACRLPSWFHLRKTYEHSLGKQEHRSRRTLNHRGILKYLVCLSISLFAVRIGLLEDFLAKPKASDRDHLHKGNNFCH